MKRLKIAFLVIVTAFIMLSPLVLSACDTGSGDDNTPDAFGVDGKWTMTRTSIQPEIQVPGPVLGLFISSRPTWEITGAAAGKPEIRYDGRERWFKIPSIGLSGLDIEVEPRSALGNRLNAVTFTTTGRITVSRFSFIGLPEFTHVVVNYRDSVEVTSASNNTITATIKVDVTSGDYTMDGVTKPITPYTATATYTGVRKK